MKRRTVVIGLDGVPFGLIDQLSQDGVMPYFQQLKEEGTFTKMLSSIPEVSSVSWSSIITGKNPGEHSVFGFTELIPETYTLSFPHSGRLKTSPFWNREGAFSIINVPSTYPAPKINGILVSGFISPDLEKAVYPREYVKVLKSLDYKIDVDTKKARKYPRVLFKELFEALESRAKMYNHVWEVIDWDVLMVVFTGTDRLEHFLWDAAEDRSHEYHHKFLEFFSHIDDKIKDINCKLGKNDSLIMLSDHGMEPCECNLNVNCLLEEKGFLKRGKDPRKGYNNIAEGTKAFALDPGRIYLNKKGKYPSGNVDPEEEEFVQAEIVEMFEMLEKDGKEVIKNIWPREKIYRGEYTEYAPDLVLLPHQGVNLKGGILSKNVYDSEILQGKHTYEDAFLYVKSDNSAVPPHPSVEDVMPVLHACMEW